MTAEQSRRAQCAELQAWLRGASDEDHVRYELVEHSEVLNPFRELFGDRRFRRGLDVGVGPYGLGFLGAHLRQQIDEIYRLDPLPLIKVDIGDPDLQQLVAEIRGRVNYIRGCGEYIPAAGGTFDIVACINVVDHACRPSRIVAEIARVLKPGGVLVFGVNTLSVLGELAWRLRRSLRPLDWLFVAHPHTFSWGSANAMLQVILSKCGRVWANKPSLWCRIAGHGRMSFWIAETKM